MGRESIVGVLSALGAESHGVFRGSEAVRLGVSRRRLTTLVAAGVIRRQLPDTYCMTAVTPSNEQALRAALLWGGEESAAAVRSAGSWYRLEGVAAAMPEIVVPRASRLRSPHVIVHRPEQPADLMIRTYRGLRVTGVESTLVALAGVLEGEAFEIACEDARRRRLTSVAALRSYLERFGRGGKRGIGVTRDLLGELDPIHAARSTLEVKARRLLVAHGITDFVREFPLVWNGREYLYDFAFERTHTILETNGRRWHDDAADYEHDNEKWSVPGRHGYRIVFATWDKVTNHPERLIDELIATRAA